MALFNAESDRDVKRKQFEKKLADKQMAHAEALTDKQLATARGVERATKWAAIAAALSAAGAIVIAVFEVLKYLGK